MELGAPRALGDRRGLAWHAKHGGRARRKVDLEELWGL